MPELWDKRAKQLLVIAGILFLIFVALRFARFFADIFIILGVSILIAYLLIGPVDFLTKIIKFRSIAVVLVYLFLIGFTATVLIFVAPKVAKEFGEFTKQIPDIITSIDTWLHRIQIYLNRNNIPVTLPSVASRLTGKFSTVSLDSLGKILGVARNTFHFIFYTLVTAVTSFYFLLDEHKIVKDLTKYIPSQYQHHIHNLVIELDKCLRGFYGAMIKLATINATVMFISYLVLKVPYALLLALWHFVSFIIPAVGGWIGLIPALLVISFTDPSKIWIPIVIYEGFTRLIQDNLITPKIMGNAIGMHPVLVLIAILVGLKTAGLIGVLFALPTFGALNVIIKYSLTQFSESK